MKKENEKKKRQKERPGSRSGEALAGDRDNNGLFGARRKKCILVKGEKSISVQFLIFFRDKTRQKLLFCWPFSLNAFEAVGRCEI